MPQKSFIIVFQRFRERVLVDFSKYLMSKVDDIEALQSPFVEEFDFKGSIFSWLIRFSDVRIRTEEGVSTFSFVKMCIHFNLSKQSFNMTELDVGDVAGALEPRFGQDDERFEDELERRLLRIVNLALRDVR